jgi:hypothetical protein
MNSEIETSPSTGSSRSSCVVATNDTSFPITESLSIDTTTVSSNRIIDVSIIGERDQYANNCNDERIHGTEINGPQAFNIQDEENPRLPQDDYNLVSSLPCIVTDGLSGDRPLNLNRYEHSQSCEEKIEEEINSDEQIHDEETKLEDYRTFVISEGVNTLEIYSRTSSLVKAYPVQEKDDSEVSDVLVANESFGIVALSVSRVRNVCCCFDEIVDGRPYWKTVRCLLHFSAFCVLSLIITILLLIALFPSIRAAQDISPTAQSQIPSRIPISKPSLPVAVATCGDGIVGNGICEDSLCCSEWGYCGMTADHCKNTPTPTPKGIDKDPPIVATCGDGIVGNGICGDSLCCSEWGYCGNTDDYCKGNPTSTPTPQGIDKDPPAVVSCGDGIVGNGKCKDNLCCSEFGFCGNTEDHCKGNPTSSPTPQGIDKDPPAVVSCGDGIVGNGKCKDNLCCSEWGFCGNTDDHCKGTPTSTPTPT